MIACTIDDIKAMLVDKIGCRFEDITPNIDITYDLYCMGDDFDELLEEYAEKYVVNLESYLWYFHNKEEGANIGSVVSKAPNERVKHIPVTPEMLLEFAQIGKWNIAYPVHKLPERRWDIIATTSFFIMFFLAIWLIKSC